MAIALRIKTKTGQHLLNSLTKENTIKDLKQQLSDITKIHINRLHVLSGFPPKALDISKDNMVLKDCGLTSGDTLIVEERATPQPAEPPPPTARSPSPVINDKTSNRSGVLMKHIVPADNSCLFSSIFFVLNGKTDETGSVAPYLRQVIAETVGSDPNKFNEAILGKPNVDYCAWIQDDKSWGGAIELSILSNYYGIEIVVVDTINGILNRFGEDQDYGQRVCLMFDGIHYDPLYLERFDGQVQTIFPIEDELILMEAQQLAKEANSSRQFTDVNKFNLKCMVCNIHLNGQVQAQQHAQQTGHMNFGEV